MASVHPECSICYDAVIDHPAPEGLEATGSHRSSCGHLFHPKCIAKWHLRQEESTCPMCRKEAVEMEDCAPQESEAEEQEDDEEGFDGGGIIRISRAGLEYIMRIQGGVGVTAGVEAELQINEFNELVIERFELERILQEQGGTPLSDAQWTQLTSVYPPAEHDGDDDDVEPVEAAVTRQLTFAPSADDEPEITDPTQRARALLANPEPPPSVVTPEDREAWALVLDSARATIARHATAAFAAPVTAAAAAAAGASWVGLGGRWRWLRPYQYRQHPCPLELFAAGDIPPAYGGQACAVCDICETDLLTIPFYHCRECEFDVCAECFMPPVPSAQEEVVHAPGPFDFVDGEEGNEGQWITLTRQAIQQLLLSHGSMATIVEFFNEEGEPPTEQTLVVTMSIESLNNRFASLGATPVTFAEVQTAVTTPPPSPLASPPVHTCTVCGCSDRVRCTCNACFSGCDRHASYGDALERSVARALLSIAAPRQHPLQVTAFADGTREVVVKSRVILNPEDE